MKELKKIKLNRLDANELLKREMRSLFGGKDCTCGCHYTNYGGSSTCDNDAANLRGGYQSYGGGGASCPCYFANDQCDTSDFLHT